MLLRCIEILGLLREAWPVSERWHRALLQLVIPPHGTRAEGLKVSAHHAQDLDKRVSRLSSHIISSRHTLTLHLSSSTDWHLRPRGRRIRFLGARHLASARSFASKPSRRLAILPSRRRPTPQPRRHLRLHLFLPFRLSSRSPSRTDILSSPSWLSSGAPTLSQLTSHVIRFGLCDGGQRVDAVRQPRRRPHFLFEWRCDSFHFRGV